MVFREYLHAKLGFNLKCTKVHVPSKNYVHMHAKIDGLSTFACSASACKACNIILSVCYVYSSV